MKIFLTTLLILFFLSNESFCQNSYQYRGKQNRYGTMLFILTSGNDTTLITGGINSKHSVVRNVLSSKGKYNFHYKKELDGDEVLNQNNEVIATTQRFFNLTFPNGRRYECRRISSDKWKYTSNGVDIVQGSYSKIGGRKIIDTTWLSSEKENKELLLVMNQIYGIKIMRLKTITPILWGVSMSAAILGAVYEAGNSSSSQ